MNTETIIECLIKIVFGLLALSTIIIVTELAQAL